MRSACYARICCDDQIAGILNRAKLRTGHGNFWTRTLVTALRCNHKIECYDAQRRLTEGWLNLTQAAQFIGTSTRTLRLAIERGEILAEKPIAVGPWLLNKQALQSESATQGHAACAIWSRPSRGTVFISGDTRFINNIT